MKIREYACPDCGKIRRINIEKVNYENYIAKNPRCRSCGAKRAEYKSKSTRFQKKHTPWNKGLDGSYSPQWKGDDAKCNTKHKWVQKKLGNPKYCEKCKRSDKEKYHWSNKDHQYSRDIKDWQRLCVKCHQRYDYEKFGNRKKFYE